MTSRRLNGLMITTTIVAALCGIIFVNHSALAQQADAWGLLPRPQRYTELYFNDFTQLASILPQKTHPVVFTIDNTEQQKTTYHYTITAISPDGKTLTRLAQGDAAIGQEQSRILSPTITLPPLGPRVGIYVEINYSAIAFGDATPTPQSQSITYWLNSKGQEK